MKRISTFFIISFVLIASISFSQGITILPSAGIQTTVSKIQGSSPTVSSFKQYQANSTFSLRAFRNNSRGHGIFLGYSTVNFGISVKANEGGNTGATAVFTGKHAFSGSIPRIELGYQLVSKKLYLNNLLSDSKSNQGVFFQFQPMVGLGFNFTPKLGSGTSTTQNGTLSFNTGARNFSLLTGANIYIGNNGRTWFFLSVMRNSNFGSHYSSIGAYNSVYNGNTYSQEVKSMGSGTTYSIGVPIKIGAKKK